MSKTVERISGTWEEHCVECGAPACYETCPRYEALKDGRCRRFERNETVRLADGTRARLVEFRPWGKMEWLYRGKMHRPGLFGKFLKAPAVPRTWHIDCEVTEPAACVCAIWQGDREIFNKTLSLVAGRNTFSFAVPPTRKYARFRFFPLGEKNLTVVFRRCRLTTAGLPDAAHAVKGLDAARPAPFLKCVAWDLDNTLWDGILAEDGAEALTLRAEAVAAVKALDARGILNTIASKNDFEPALARLRRFGIEEYFVFPEINWGPKSVSLRHAAGTLNIGLDTFAFVDDSAHERGEVAAHLPMVRVFDATQIGELLAAPAANPEVSPESANRRLSYRSEMTRRSVERASGYDRTAFLRACQIRLACRRLDAPELAVRCRELVQRTNQLTLAARRYSDAEFRRLLDEPGVAAHAISCTDRYGDYGIVGFVALAHEADALRVREFVMSCRVAKKLCEQSVLLFLARAEMAKNPHAARLEADVVPTGRNQALVDAFDAMPFSCTVTPACRRYAMPLDGSVDLAGVFTNEVAFFREDAP